MSTNVVIQFDNMVAIVHILCIAVQIGILLYVNHNGKSNHQTYNNNNQGGYQR